MALLLILPVELLVRIAEAGSSSDIKHLSETCRYLHDKLVSLHLVLYNFDGNV
jgi:hypothetical protein